MAGYEFSYDEEDEIKTIVGKYLDLSDCKDWSEEEYTSAIRSLMHEGMTFEFAKKKAFESAMKRLVKSEVDEKIEALKLKMASMRQAREAAYNRYLEKLLSANSTSSEQSDPLVLP